MALANIIDEDDFTGILYLNVAGTTEVPVAKQAKLDNLITEYQQKIFRELFGEALYQYLTDNQGEAVYTTLLNGERVTIDGDKYQYQGLKEMLASFVYYYYKKRSRSQDLGLGEQKSLFENAERANTELREKMTEAWNNGVDLYLDVISYINYKNEESTDYYPEFSPNYDNYGKEII